MSRRSIAIWLVAACVHLLGVATLAAQDSQPVPTVSFDGSEVFTYLLQSRKLTPLQGFDDLPKVDPRDTVVVIFGRNETLAKVPPEFVRRGGNLFVATDFADEGRLFAFGAAVSGHAVVQATGGAYRNNPKCPLVLSFTDACPMLLAGLEGHGLATNRPSYINIRADGPLALFAGFPPDCRDADVRRLALRHAPFMACTPATMKTAGRLAVAAGHGMFTNGMLLQNDNDNFRFAVNCVDWLSEGTDGDRRQHALFVVDGQVIDRFDAGLKPPSLPTPPLPMPTIQVVNQLLQGLEREGFFIRLLRDSFDLHQTMRFSLGFLTILVLFVGAKKLAEQRHHAERGIALLVGAYAPPPQIAAIVEQRHGSQLTRDGFWEQGRALARQTLYELCAIDPAQWDVPGARPEPVLVCRGSWYEQWRLRRGLVRLADFAGQRQHGRFSWVALVRMTHFIQDFRRAVSEGRAHFAGCSPRQNF